VSNPATPGAADAKAWRRHSQLAFGLAVVCGLFVSETLVAHRSAPHPASPVIWAVLGTVAVGALGAALWCRLRAARLEHAARPPAAQAGSSTLKK